VRDACLAAVRAVASECGKWIAVGAGRTPTEIGAGARGSFRGYGVDVPVTLSGDDVRDPREKSVALPLPALVAGWLRERADAASVRVRVLDQALPRAACVGLGHRLGEDEDGVGLLIYDGNYTDDEFVSRAGWGHSTWQEGVRIAKAASAGALAIFHHDPDHDDDFLDGVRTQAKALHPGAIVAAEGMVLPI